jgi:hypothetical protein
MIRVKGVVLLEGPRILLRILVLLYDLIVLGETNYLCHNYPSIGVEIMLLQHSNYLQYN